MTFATVVLALTLFAQGALSRAIPQRKKPPQNSNAVERDVVFPFTGKLLVEGRVVRGSIRKSEIDDLLARRVRLLDSPSDGEYGLGFSFEEGHFPVFSCQEWMQVRAQGSGGLNTRETVREAPFVDTCSFLSALRLAKPARRSFIANPKVGLSNLNLLPANVLESLSGEGVGTIQRLTARGVKISDLVAKRKVKVLARTKNSVRLDYDLEMHLTEMGRADFDGDGIEDIFVSTAKYATPGTFRYFDYFILTRRSPAAGFVVKNADWKTLSKHSMSLSAGIDLKSSQLTKVRIARKEYGDDWPFEVDEGELACANAGSIAVFFVENGKAHALNAWARKSKIDGQPVLTDTIVEVLAQSNAKMIYDKAFAMCPQKEAKR